QWKPESCSDRVGLLRNPRRYAIRLIGCMIRQSASGEISAQKTDFNAMAFLLLTACTGGRHSSWP
ncbi:hypothetical protein, partial [Escherichia coli]|uniref:hypothetical protein n=1 Tax=Escherichia coli TaxID=562 RepID=UPI001952B602